MCELERSCAARRANGCGGSCHLIHSLDSLDATPLYTDTNMIRHDQTWTLAKAMLICIDEYYERAR